MDSVVRAVLLAALGMAARETTALAVGEEVRMPLEGRVLAQVAKLLAALSAALSAALAALVAVPSRGQVAAVLPQCP